VAGAARTDIFSPGAIDYIFRCAAGIPRQINNLCDNALLTGYASGLHTISRAVIEEVADTFDMLPDARNSRLSIEEQESPARIFNAQGRAELWSAGSTQATAVDEAVQGSSTRHSSAHDDDEREEELEDTPATPSPDVNDIGAAFRRWDVMGDR
jgi:hypothetical protein